MPILLTSTISTTRLTTAPITTATSGVTLSLAARKAAWMTTVGRAVCCVFVICLFLKERGEMAFVSMLGDYMLCK